MGLLQFHIRNYLIIIAYSLSRAEIHPLLVKNEFQEVDIKLYTCGSWVYCEGG